MKQTFPEHPLPKQLMIILLQLAVSLGKVSQVLESFFQTVRYYPPTQHSRISLLGHLMHKAIWYTNIIEKHIPQPQSRMNFHHIRYDHLISNKKDNIGAAIYCSSPAIPQTVYLTNHTKYRYDFSKHNRYEREKQKYWKQYWVFCTL